MRFQQMMVYLKLIFPLRFSATITTFIISVSLGTSYDYNCNYENCYSLYTCGKLQNIGYPFWGAGRPSCCGLPELELICPRNHSDDYPTMTFKSKEYLDIPQSDGNDLQNVSYRVLNIYKSYQSVTIQVQELPLVGTCPFFSINASFHEIELFDYSPSVENISLFYDCPNGQIMEHTYSSTCLGNRSNNVTYYLPRLLVSENRKNNRFKSCNRIRVPVLRKDLDDLNNGNGNLSNVLEQGFELKYAKPFPEACSLCQVSGGICVSSNLSDFLCYCKDKNLQPTECKNSGKRRKPRKLSVILGIGCSGVGILMLSVLVFYRRKRSISKVAIFCKGSAAEEGNVDVFLKICGSLAPKRYTYASIRKMTNNFKDKLGEGGYACVYKGKLCNGRLVAVKLFKQTKGDGNDFINEVASIGGTNHVNIVALLGYCFEGKKRALIYEFMPNGSLEKFIYCGGSTMSLSWETVLDIAVGIARGLDYLHRGCNARILHFDIKPHNILLDENFRPKISDFGLARLCCTQESTISMLEARGTIGYIAPEVFCRNFGGVSHKSDVYSYGMMVLDLVCGRTNISAAAQRSSELYFPQWIYNQLELEEEVVVDGIMNDEDKALRRKMILVSLWCIQTYPSNRPSMSRVLEMLNGCLESIQIPPKSCLSSPPRLAFDSSGISSTKS